jgi:hypothetical protein
VRVALALGHNLTASGEVGFAALFRHELQTSGERPIAFNPIVFLAFGLGYAF